MKKYLLALALLTASFSSQAALISVLGGQGVYDDVADLTWLADANYAQTSDYDADGRMTWSAANTWAANLTVNGVGGWRLATTTDVGNDGGTYLNSNIYTGVDAGYNMTVHSELSNLWYNALGNTPYYDTLGNSAQSGWGLSNTGLFTNVQSDGYWSATEYLPNTTNAWGFNTRFGSQGYEIKTNSFYAWAVQSGNVDATNASVPLPSVLWLMLGGLLGFKRQLHR